MKTYKTQQEVEADIKDGWLIVNDDVTFQCDIKIDANIDARDIRYYAVCFAYNDITCKSIVARRENGRHFVLDGELKIG